MSVRPPIRISWHCNDDVSLCSYFEMMGTAFCTKFLFSKNKAVSKLSTYLLSREMWYMKRSFEIRLNFPPHFFWFFKRGKSSLLRTYWNWWTLEIIESFVVMGGYILSKMRLFIKKEHKMKACERIMMLKIILKK